MMRIWSVGIECSLVAHVGGLVAAPRPAGRSGGGLDFGDDGAEGAPVEAVVAKGAQELRAEDQQGPQPWHAVRPPGLSMVVSQPAHVTTQPAHSQPAPIRSCDWHFMIH